MVRYLSFYRLVVVNKKQSITTGFSAKPKGKLDNAAGTHRVFFINRVLLFNGVNIKEHKPYLCSQHCLAMHMWQDSMCSWTKGCCSSLYVVAIFLSISISVSWAWTLLSEAVSPTLFASLSFQCFISVLGDCFPLPCGGSWLGC